MPRYQQNKELRQYALSIRQPWCSLILHGIKTIEVRTWNTNYRGSLFLHSSSIPDEREVGWSLLSSSARASTSFLGGIIAEAQLVDCVYYQTLEAFHRDQNKHHNLPGWFRPEGLYGFVLERVRAVPFYRYKGNARLFTVPIKARGNYPWQCVE